MRAKKTGIQSGIGADIFFGGMPIRFVVISHPLSTDNLRKLT